MAQAADSMAEQGVRAFERTGRRLAVHLWVGSILCWWVAGVALSHLWWLVNDLQQSWFLFCYAWEVPVIGWTGAVLLPYSRWRALGRRLYGGDAAAVREIARYPARVAGLILGTSTLGYIAAALQLAWFAKLPLSEFIKVVAQGPVVGGAFAVAGYLLAERAVRRAPIPAELLKQAESRGSASQSLYVKVLGITMALMLGVATPVFLLGVTQDQRRREDVRGSALRRFVASQHEIAEVERQMRAFGEHSYAFIVDRSSGVIVDGADEGKPLASLALDHDSLLLHGNEGWFASRHRTHQVVGYTRRGETTWVVVSVFGDYGQGLLDDATTAAALFAVALGVGLALAAMLARSVVDPMVRLRAAASRMAGGDLDVGTVAITGGDEVAALAREFDRMAIRVREEEARLRAALAELERTQGQLVQAERLSAIGRLVSGVAHELNNPLAAILHYAEDLRADPARTANDREALDAITSQSRRCRAIVRDLLSFARGREARRSLAGLDELVARVVRALRPVVLERGVRLETQVDPGLPQLVLDADGIEQVLTNLVDNALYAAGKGGTVRIAAEADGEGWRITVEDDGPGILPEVLPRIFEPFFTTKPQGQGTGLGLAVSLGIVHRAGGTLVVENRTDGRGARSVVRLPGKGPALVPERPRSTPAPSVPAAPADSADVPRVLVVDDEVVLRTALRRFFRRRDWEIDEAPDGGRALELIESRPPGYYRAVLSDLKMPGFSGIEMHDWLAGHRPDLHARLILMTGDVASPDVHAFLARTRRPVLEKPFELHVLADALERLE